jgi:hypothetical protein
MRAVARHLGVLIDSRSQRAVADVISGLSAAASQGGNASSDQAAVDAAAKVWKQRIRQELANRALAPSERGLFELLLADLEGVVRADDPFAEIFAAVSGCAATVYEHNWPAKARLVMRYESYYNRPDNYGVRAAMLAGEEGPEVKLVPYLDRFGPEAYAALPCALAHECVCHVPAQQLGDVDNESLFAEGFMDYAASCWVKTWAAGLPTGFADLIPDHEQRYRDAILAAAPERATARKGGRRVARHLSRLLQNPHGYSVSRADERVASLAVRLNSYEAPLLAKEEFLDGIDYESDGPLPEPLLGALKGERPIADIMMQLP